MINYWKSSNPVFYKILILQTAFTYSKLTIETPDKCETSAECYKERYPNDNGFVAFIVNFEQNWPSFVYAKSMLVRSENIVIS